MMSTHMDPGFLVKLNWPDAGFGVFADRNAIIREPPLKPAPVSPISREVFKRNTELVKENTLVEFRAKSLQVLIEKDRDTIASQEVIISEYKDKLADAEAKGRILEDMLSNATDDAQKLREETRVLSEGLLDATTQITFYESELRHKKARVLALEVAARDSIAKLDTVTGDLETARATLGLEVSQLEAQLAQVRKEKEATDAVLREEVKKLAESGKELEEVKGKLATEEVEKAALEAALEALEAKNATLEKALEGKEAELAQARMDIEIAKEEIARLEATLKSTQDDLAGTQDILVKEREDFALARQKHTDIQDNFTRKCSDLETSLKDTKSALSSTQDQLTATESTVHERDTTIQGKNEEISRLHKQVAGDRERAQATINAMDARILGLQDEVMETRSSWKDEADSLKGEVREAKDKLESAWVEFEAFKEDANTRTAFLEGRVDTLTGELEVKDRELQVTAGNLKTADNKVGDLTAQLSALSQRNEEHNTVLEDRISTLTNSLELSQGELQISEDKVLALNTQLMEKDAALDTLAQTHQAETAALEDRIALLTNDLESKNRDLEASNDEVVALHIQLAEQGDELSSERGVVDDLDEIIDEKNKYIEEIKVQHDDEVARLNAYILALEKELEAAKAAFPTTVTALDFDDTETQCNLPQAASHPEKSTLEQSDIGHEAEDPENPESFATQEYFRVYTRRGRDPVVICPPHSDTSWRVKNGKMLGSDRRPPPMNFVLPNSAPIQSSAASSEASAASGGSAQLSVTAVAFVPRGDTPAGPSQQHAGPSLLRPTAASFQPSCKAIGAPNVSSHLTPEAHTFVPREVPTPDAPRLQVTAPAFVPRQPATINIDTSLNPIATTFVAPQLRRDATPFILGRGPSIATLPAPPVDVDSLRLPENATTFVPSSSSVVFIPPQVAKIHGLDQENEVPSTDTNTNTSGVQESVSSASLSADSTLVFDDSVEAITRRESNYELSQLDSSVSLIKIASLISCPCLRVSF
ncbi:hypothetical protein NLI96_g4439 [Meripilus lineatus]|uniref:Uncharacterized protein n=1 Tax=Meripilus lineatus TaxID=2056292 RepID=A0AAD5V9X2_9APHY|nr:hypothetical protein NLI96_g4439 [Physisporinus lineatus]